MKLRVVILSAILSLPQICKAADGTIPYQKEATKTATAVMLPEKVKQRKRTK